MLFDTSAESDESQRCPRVHLVSSILIQSQELEKRFSVFLVCKQGRSESGKELEGGTHFEGQDGPRTEIGVVTKAGLLNQISNKAFPQREQTYTYTNIQGQHRCVFATSKYDDNTYRNSARHFTETECNSPSWRRSED